MEAAAVARGMLEGEVEHTRVPRIPLDVLCQQIVAMASVEELQIDELHALVRRAYPYRELTREQLENVLDLLAGRYPSDEFAELRPRIVWERTTGTLRAREGAQRIAIANAGTIPDRGLYGVFLVDGGGRVGELDEEMVHEAREGQVFLLGASAWRIEQIERDRVIVSPAPGQPAQVPFWKGEQAGRPLELGRAVGRLQRELAALDDESAVQRLMGLHACDERAARTLVEYLREQELATGVLPSDRTIVVERFRDEIGDWRLCILSPFGAKVHAPWGLALRALLREQHGIETHALWSDDGIILHLPDADSLPPDELVAIDPERIEDLVVGELGGSSLFGARFRESAARALLIPRRRPGQRTPLWQQRLRAQSLLAVAERYGSFPILLETYRELLADHFDLGALRELLAGLRDGSRQLVAVESQTASPFAASLNFEYVAQYLYEDDAPAAERRVAALTLDRDLLRELAGSDELRDLLDADALEQVELELGSERRGGPDALHDLLRRVGDLAESELATRLPGDATEAVAELLADRRAVRAAHRRRGSPDRRRGHRALPRRARHDAARRHAGRVPRARAGRAAVARARASHAGADRSRPGSSPSATTSSPPSPSASWRRSSATGALVHGALRPGGSGREWCDVEVLRRIRRASVARLRREVEAVEQPALARFALAWHGTGRNGPRRHRPPARGALPAAAPAARTRGVGAPGAAAAHGLPPGAARSALHERRGRVARRRRRARRARVPRGRRACSGRRPGRRRRRPIPPPRPCGQPCRARATSRELAAETGLPEAEVIEALWRLVASGEVTNDAWEPLRRDPPRGDAAHAHAARWHAPADAQAPPPRGAALGRWAPTAPLLPPRSTSPIAGARSRSCCSSATACSCAPQWSPRACPAGRPGCAAHSASSRRSASRAAATSSTASAAHSTRCPARSSACARCATRPPTPPRSPWPRAIRPIPTASPCAGRRMRPAAPRARRARSSCCATASRWRSSSAERARCSRCSRSSSPTGPRSPSALATASLEGRVGSLQLERIDGEPATGTPVGAAFTAAGLRRRPEAPDAAREALSALPEGHTLEVAARRIAPLVGPASGRDRAWLPVAVRTRGGARRAGARVGRGPRQAPAAWGSATVASSTPTCA